MDLYFAHRDDQQTPLDETLAAFNDLVKAGKVRVIGASNYSTARLQEALNISQKQGYARYECLQPYYNVIDREEYERELEPVCRAEGLGVVVYSSLAGGFLSGKYRQGQQMPDTGRAPSVQRRYMNERGWRTLAAVEQVAARYKATPSQIALAWILARPSITCPIASATSVEQMRELLGSLDVKLDEQALAELSQPE